MDPNCLAYALTDTEAAAFERDGFLIVEDALSAEQVGELSELLDRLVADGGFTRTPHPSRDGRVNAIDIAGLHPSPAGPRRSTRARCPRCGRILGWNIHLYHSHYITAPQIPRPANGEAERRRWAGTRIPAASTRTSRPTHARGSRSRWPISSVTPARPIAATFGCCPGATCGMKSIVLLPATASRRAPCRCACLLALRRAVRPPALARRVAELRANRPQGALLWLFPPLGSRPRRGDRSA